MPVLWSVGGGDDALNAQVDDFGRVARVVVEALAALAAVQAGEDHAFEERGRRVAALAVLGEHDLGDLVGRVEPHEVEQRERAHWVAAPELHRLVRSEEHTSELQSLAYLVCRLLLEKKKKEQ